jgi:hypothetical protein
VLDICGTDKIGRGLLRLLLVDHQIIEDEDIVLVANGTAVTGIDEHDHWEALSGQMWKYRMALAQADELEA